MNTHLARESNSHEPGGVLSQAGFPDAAPRRWDDQIFENRLKHALQSVPRKPRSQASPRSTPRSVK